jgi:hypothetical protein
MLYARSDVQCREKWFNALDPSLRVGDYTSTELLTLRLLVARLGEGNWARIASYLPGRTDASVRRKWKTICPEQEEGSKRKAPPLPAQHSK